MRFLFCALAVALMLPSAAFANIIIGSWNIQNLGWDNNKRYDKVAHIANHFDVLAIQELMNEEALERLEAELEAASDESWSSMASHALGRSTYREHYGFVWRDSAVSYDSGAVVYIDSRDVFAREPFSAQFRSDRTGQQFALANVHITYGRSIGDRLPEIEALASYWQWLEEVYPDTPRLLVGDFNLRPSHNGWEPLKTLGAIPAITAGATTLGTSEGVWSNLYDNFWKSPGQLNITSRGIVQFPELLEADHVTARSIVSDHAPVWLALGTAELQLSSFLGAAYEAANDPTYCIDLNEATAEQLAELPNVGPVRAEHIIEMRPWTNADELSQVSGLGVASVETIKNSGLVCP
ncbi:helix-hairpin-helix domain-containing protein [Vreelandella aquamarina]|uniref:helix-hairpin-helix domain-containing protein n=1 Tax=Vreelandella aquamarina TaxID=77097 RepID=UPI0005E8FCA7|nr:helix-hairpin-helix domain-containing protein [Halomonas meridiana]KJD19873.1 endonuclease [Halomonas meridiana]